MTKNILAIAIAAAVMAPSAFAAATVYGVAHVGLAQQEGIATAAADTTTASQTSVLSNSSRLGIKGSEDLGAGMKAVYQMEFSVGMDGEGNSAGVTGASARNTFAGLAGGFGTVLVGRHDSLIKMTGRKYDLFGDQVGNNRNILGGTTTSGFVDGRHSNVLAYISPTWSGVHFGAAYIPSGATADNEQNSNNNGAAVTKTGALTALVDYTAGAFSVTGGYINIDNAVADNSATANSGFTAYRLGAGYSFGAAKIVGLYQNGTIAGGATTAKKTNDVYGLGGSYKVGSAGTIKAQYYIAGNTAAAGADKTGASMASVGYDHAMSKNTTAYVAYTMVDNDAAGAFTANMANGGAGDNTVAATGKDNSAVSVGLIHNF